MERNLISFNFPNIVSIVAMAAAGYGLLVGVSWLLGLNRGGAASGVAQTVGGF
jgi:hypothetical protein